MLYKHEYNRIYDLFKLLQSLSVYFNCAIGVMTKSNGILLREMNGEGITADDPRNGQIVEVLREKFSEMNIKQPVGHSVKIFFPPSLKLALELYGLHLMNFFFCLAYDNTIEFFPSMDDMFLKKQMIEDRNVMYIVQVSKGYNKDRYDENEDDDTTTTEEEEVYRHSMSPGVYRWKYV